MSENYIKNLSPEQEAKREARMEAYREKMSKFKDTPIFVILENDTEREKTIKLFAPAENPHEDENIKSAYSTIGYSFIQKVLLSKEFNIGMIRLHAKSEAFERKLEEDPNQKNFFYDVKPIVAISKSIFGEEMQMPIFFKEFIDDEAEQKAIIDIDRRFKLDCGTGFNFIIPPKTTISVAFFILKQTVVEGILNYKK